MSEPKKRIIRLAEVMQRTGKSRTSVYRDMGKGTFPLKVQTGDNTVGWLESEIESWIDSCIEASRGAAA